MGACRCAERDRPFVESLRLGSNERPRQWFVINRNTSRSAFSGYREEWSAFSTVCCRVCGAWWKSKASFISKLTDCEYFPDRVSPRVEAIKP